MNFSHTNKSKPKKDISLNEIDKRITDLRDEAAKIQSVYQKLAAFLYTHALLPVNDDLIEYLQYFIREEQMKQSAGADNADVLESLERMLKEFTDGMELFKKTLQEQRNSGTTIETIRPEDIFPLVTTLYDLPINGQQIRDQVAGIQRVQGSEGVRRETKVRLPAKAAASKVMIQMINVTSGTTHRPVNPSDDDALTKKLYR